MASNEILKTIKIKVDSAEYRALLASMSKLLDIERQINKLHSQSAQEYNLKVKKLTEQLALMREALATGQKWKKLEGDALKLEIEKVEKQKKLLALNRKLAAEKKRAADQERQARLREAQDTVASNAAARARETKRQQWEQGQESTWFRGKRYRDAGVMSPFMFLSERAEEAGTKRVAGLNEEIAQRQDQIKANETKMGLLTSELSDPSSELSAKQRRSKLEELEMLRSQNKALGSQIEERKDERSQAIGETKTKVSKYAAMGEAAQRATAAVAKAANVLLDPFKKLASAVKDAIDQMLSFSTGVATYSMSSSLVTNAKAREQQLKYGLTGSQNYGFTMAKSMLGIESEEDLMYMNTYQRDKLLEYMSRYSRWYDRMESSGVLEDVQEMQLEFAELKQELAMEFLQWVAANKETIMGMIKGIFEFIKGIADVVGRMMSLFSGGKYREPGLASLSDTTNYESTTNSRTTVVNVTANTTNNATGVLSSQEALDQFSKENFSKLAKQLAIAIGG